MASEPKSTLLLTIDFTSNKKNKEEKTNKQTNKKNKQTKNKNEEEQVFQHTQVDCDSPTMAKLLLIVEKLISLLAQWRRNWPGRPGKCRTNIFHKCLTNLFITAFS